MIAQQVRVRRHLAPERKAHRRGPASGARIQPRNVCSMSWLSVLKAWRVEQVFPSQFRSLV